MANTVSDVVALNVLKTLSICIPTVVIVCNTNNDEEIAVDMTDVVLAFDNCYSTNGRVICFVHDGEIFITPYTRSRIASIKRTGLVKKYFDIPVKNEYAFPKHKKERWFFLWELAYEDYDRDYKERCAEWCDVTGVCRELNDRIISHCLRIPREGIEVQRPSANGTYYIVSHYKPICDESRFAPLPVRQFGLYCDGPNVVFVYRDGHTYIAKGHWVVKELERVGGYTKCNLYTPFSAGEKIIDPYLANRWEKLPSE